MREEKKVTITILDKMKLLILVFLFIISCNRSELSHHENSEKESKDKNYSLVLHTEYCNEKKDCIKKEDPKHFCASLREGLRQESINIFQGFWWSTRTWGPDGLRYNVHGNGKVEIIAFRSTRDGSKSDQEFLKSARRYPVNASITIINKTIVYIDFIPNEEPGGGSTAFIDMFPTHGMKVILKSIKKSGTTNKIICAVGSDNTITSYGVLKIDEFILKKELKESQENYETEIKLNDL